MRKSALLLSLLATVLVACGGDTGPEDDAFRPPAAGGGGAAATVSSLSLVTSSPTIPSDGTTPVEITAFVKNASNQFMTDVPVTFSSSSGGLLVTQGNTDQSGIAKATLSSAGDPSNRTITVTAIAGGITETIDIGVAGTTLSVQGPLSLAQSQQGTYTVQLLDAGNGGIPNRQVTVTSARNNALSPAAVTTDANGRGTFNMTATNANNDTITVSGLGVTSTLAVAVNSGSFSVISPAANSEVPLGSSQAVTVRLLSGGVPVAGQAINFATTRGTVTPTSAVTNAAGEATTSVSANNAGGAIVSALSGMASAQVALEFVATIPASIDVQPSVFTLSTNQSSTITAVVRDAAGNLVKNQTVTFSLNDVTGGTLSVGSAMTDSQGRAQTVYTSSNTTSANGGVQITATVAGVPPSTVALTVAGRQVFLSIGTGNEVAEPNPAQYRMDYIVQVTDSNGNGVSGVPVSLRILSTVYYKGFRVAAAAPATGWTTSYSVVGGCADEDLNRNGTLDATEDFNTSGRLEAGNIALVSPSNAVTDAQGFVLVAVYYPQEYAYYLDVALSASTTVQGTEYVRTANFALPGLATDFNDTSKAPPGPVSPFGTANACTNPL